MATPVAQFVADLEVPLSRVINDPHRKNITKRCILHSVSEMMSGMSDKANQVTVIAAEALVRKDFAQNADEGQMRKATVQVLRSMTAGLAAINSRDPLLQSIQGYLKQAFITPNMPPAELAKASPPFPHHNNCPRSRPRS